MAIIFEFDKFLSKICQEVGFADIEMQLLQKQAWNDLLKAHFAGELLDDADKVVQTKQDVLDELDKDKFLALNEVSLKFNLKKRSSWSRFWYRIFHPSAINNPNFKLTNRNPSNNSLEIEIILKRTTKGDWKVQESEYKKAPGDLQFMID